MKAKSSKRLYDNAMKLQTYYSHLFTDTIALESNNWYKKLKDTIDEQQTQPLWISADLDKLMTEQQQQQMMLEEASAVVQQQQIESKRFDHMFDDNFEFPIYTAANNMGAASSTYSLFEENCTLTNGGRSSIAASDSDLCSSIMNNGVASVPNKMINSASTHFTHNESQIYSTNFKQVIKLILIN